MTNFNKSIALSVTLLACANIALSQNVVMNIGQSTGLTTYLYQNGKIQDLFTHISLDSVGIFSQPNVYDMKIRKVANGAPNTWLSYQILQGSPISQIKMEIAVNPFNQFSATVKRFELNDPVFDATTDYEWKKLDSIQMFLTQLAFQNPDSTFIGEWTDTMPHYLAFRYFGQPAVGPLYGYIKLTVKSEFQISEVELYELAIQNGVLKTGPAENLPANWSVSPNPTSGFLQVSLSENADLAQIFNEKGEILWSKQNLGAGGTSIETAPFPSGNYWLKILLDGKTRTTMFTVIH